VHLLPQSFRTPLVSAIVSPRPLRNAKESAGLRNANGLRSANSDCVTLTDCVTLRECATLTDCANAQTAYSSLRIPISTTHSPLRSFYRMVTQTKTLVLRQGLGKPSSGDGAGSLAVHVEVLEMFKRYESTDGKQCLNDLLDDWSEV